MKTNLRQLASEIARKEGLRSSVGVAQLSEFLAIMGIRWREMSHESVFREVACIVERAGLLSEHQKSLADLDLELPDTEIGGIDQN